MKRLLIATITLLIVVVLPLVQAQVPTPPMVPTLGPAVICSNGENITIFSPQNKTYSNNQISLYFSVAATGMFAQFGNVGYSLDGGTIYSVNYFINKTVDHPSDAPDWYWNRTTVFASLALPKLSEGPHNVTVYYGWQYLGTNNPSLERFEVFAYQTASFTVSTEVPITNQNVPPSTSNITTSPTSTISEFQTASPYLPYDRNAPHLDPIFYLIPISIIVAIAVIANIILRRRTNKQGHLSQTLLKRSKYQYMDAYLFNSNDSTVERLQRFNFSSVVP